MKYSSAKTRNQKMRATAADNDRNPMRTPNRNRTGETVKRLTGTSSSEPPPPLSSRSPNVPISRSPNVPNTFIDVLRGNATGLGAVNLQGELAQMGDGAEETTLDFNATMRQLASEQARTLVMKNNTEFSVRMSQTMKEKHDPDLPETERIAMWMSQLTRNTPPSYGT